MSCPELRAAERRRLSVCAPCRDRADPGARWSTDPGRRPYLSCEMSLTAEPNMTSARAAVPPRTMPASRDDRRLADALRAGDARALETFHARYGGTVFGYLLNTLRERAAAEDVFQTVMTEVWRRAPRYDPERGSLATWALTIARSRAIDELRRRRPEPFDPADLPEPTGGIGGGAASAVAPQDEALDRWRMAHLLAQLPSEERRLLELRFYAELSQSEIASRTGMPLGTIKSRMVRGLERLRGLMDEEGLA
jgi:RNA polymerase sigma-70 factor, ECF subfamily